MIETYNFLVVQVDKEPVVVITFLLVKMFLLFGLLYFGTGTMSNVLWWIRK